MRPPAYYALVAVAASLCVAGTCGCRGPQEAATQPASSTIGQLSDVWARSWARAADPRLAAAYEAYSAHRSARPRGTEFAKLVIFLGATARVRDVSAEWCLAMLGNPDAWKLAPNGEAWLVYYFFTDDPGVGHSEFFLCVDAGGRLRKALCNAADPKEDVRVGFHP